MNQEQEKDSLYYYLDKVGHKCYTPNYEFAYYRAKFYGTKEVFEVRN